jgi:hypothetical protein
MYSAARTAARPPHTLRRPRTVPLSRFSGATPTSFGDGFAIELAELRQLAEQRRRDDRPDARNGAQQLFPLAPQGTGAELLAELVVDLLDLAAQPVDVLSELRAQWLRTVLHGRGQQPVLLRGEHLLQLPTAVTSALRARVVASDSGRVSGRMASAKWART